MQTDPTSLFPDSPEKLFLILFTGAGALFGVISTWITDRIFEVWEERTHASVSETKRRWISLAVPIGVVLLGYAGCLALGVLPLTSQTAYLAAMNSLSAAVAKQITYAAAESYRKGKETE